MEKKKGITKTSTVISLVMLALIYGFAAAPALAASLSDGTIISLYFVTNSMFRGPSGGLLSAWIFVAITTFLVLTNLWLSFVHEKDRNGNKLDNIVGDSYIGGFELLNGVFMFCAGMLFSFTQYFARINYLANGVNPISWYSPDSNWTYVAWGSVVVAILCFLLCLYSLYSGAKKISYRAQLRAEAMAQEESYK